jgi:predicted metalloprotease with PDZ domain
MPCFAVAAISIDGFLPQITRRDRRKSFADLMKALWRVNLMLVLNRLLLNKGYILMNVLKALASIVSVCKLRTIFSSKITPRYFTLFTNGISRPFNLILYKCKSKLYYDRRSDGQSILVSSTYLGPTTNFSPSLFNYF